MADEDVRETNGASFVADLRVRYDDGQFEPQDLRETPRAQFDEWFAEVVSSGVVAEPNAMVIATVDAAGTPSTRTVLLKGVDDRGLSFFTNLGSRKSRDLQQNSSISATFPWHAMHRQVTVMGDAELLPRSEVEAYFRSRPHESQLGAWVSEQSSVISSRDVVDDRWRELADRYPPDSVIPVPDFWGGWLIRPRSVEFWQGRPSRLHDRLQFVGGQGRGDGWSEALGWVVQRLSP